jgi:YHS domain-containing protein
MHSTGWLFTILMTIAAAATLASWAYISHTTPADDAALYTGTCLVMSSPLEQGKAVEVTYNGKRYMLCCIACKSVFEHAPEKFIKERTRQDQAQVNVLRSSSYHRAP